MNNDIQGVDKELRTVLADETFLSADAKKMMAGTIVKSYPMGAAGHIMSDYCLKMVNYHSAHNTLIHDGRRIAYCADNRGVFITTNPHEDFALEQWKSFGALPNTKLFTWEQVADAIGILSNLKIDGYTSVDESIMKAGKPIKKKQPAPER